MLKESWHKFRFPIVQFKEESKDLSDDIKFQVVEEIKTTLFGLFAIQIDESTDISLCAQLMVFVKYVHNDIKKEFFFCSPLEKTTKAVEKLADECQDKFLELINDSTARQEYEEKLLLQFWVAIKDFFFAAN